MRPHPLDQLPRWLDAQRAKSLFKMVYLKIDSGAPAEARDLLDRALKLDDAEADIWYLRGYARRQLGDLAGAHADFTECLKLRPGHTGAFEDRAALEWSDGRRTTRVESPGAPSPESFSGISVATPTSGQGATSPSGGRGAVGNDGHGTDGRRIDIEEAGRQ